MRLVAFVLFWAGMFMAVREWVYARKHGLAITRAEKLYLAMAFPLSFGALLALDLMGVPRVVATASSVIAMGVALSAWAVRRRIRRANSRGLSKA
jgi:hypothetical protein